VEEFLLELLLELLGEPLLTGVARALAATLPNRWRESPWLAGVGYVLVGLLLSGLSIWLVPHHLLKSPVLRAANFVAAPILCGFTLSLVGVWRQRRHRAPSLMDGFRYGMLFGLTVQLVRALAIP
jgi:hypothetical protein